MSEFSDYLTVSGISVSESTVKGSRFIGIAMPCTCEEDIRSNLKRVQAEFPNATHYCYGAVFGGTNRSERSSDNGEPSGTAAKPILSVIRGNSLTDTMVVVVRYFGGTLLGTGGLVHAYTESAEESIKCASIRRMYACSVFGITLGYSDLNPFNCKCANLCAEPPKYVYEASVSIEAAVPVGKAEEFLAAVSEATERRARVVPLGSGYR